jgi:hypothetical protein
MAMKKNGVEEVDEDGIYRIRSWGAHQRGKIDGEGGQHDILAATEDNTCSFFMSIEWGRRRGIE